MIKIQQSLARIEGQLDKILKTPLNNAIEFFKNIINAILTGNFEDAYKRIDKLDTEATTAYNYADGNDLSVKEFREWVKAIRLKMFATIMNASYDAEAKVFLPSNKLPNNKVAQIGLELEGIVKRCLEQKSKVDTTKFFGAKDSSMKKSKAQDILDSVLKMAYPYISQYKKTIGHE